MIRTIEEKLSIPREIFLIPTFTLLTALGAYVRIPLPFTPVPITLQVLFVLLAGSFRYGYLSQLTYLGLGLTGVPLFAMGGGLGYLFGPTGGYLLSFPIAALLINILIERGWSFYIASLLGIAVIYLFGTAQLSIYLSLPFINALKLGSIPFIPFDIAKALIAASLMHKIIK